MIKSYNVIYLSVDDLIDAKSQLGVYDEDNVLIQVFTCKESVADIKLIQNDLKEIFPGVKVIGVTTGGEILDGQSLENKTVISITVFEHSCVRTSFIPFVSNDDNDQAIKADLVIDELKEEDLKATIIFANSINDNKSFINIIPFLKHMKEGLPEVIFSGGGAGNYYANYNHLTTVFTEYEVTQQGLVVAGLYGDNLNVINKENLSWVPIGKRLTVHDVEGRVLKKLDGLKPLEVYNEYLGEEIAKLLPLSAAEFPFIFERSGYEMLVHPMEVYPNGEILLSHELRVGERIRFSYCHAGLLSLSAHNMCSELIDEGIQVNFIYSCSIRKEILGEDVAVELYPMSRLSPSSGFFAFGEYFDEGRVISDHYRLGQIMSVLALREGEVKCSPIERQNVNDKSLLSESRQFRTLRVMHRLIDKSSRDLEMALTSLSQLAHKDALTGLYNRGFFDKYFNETVKDHARSGAKFSIILLDVDYFKNYNDTYGHVAGDDVLRGIGHCLRTQVNRGSDKVSRYGGEEFAVILPNTDLIGAKVMANKIRSAIEKLKIPHRSSEISEILTVSVGCVCVDQTNRHDFSDNLYILEACDVCLYQAKEEGRNRVVAKQMYDD